MRSMEEKDFNELLRVSKYTNEVRFYNDNYLIKKCGNNLEFLNYLKEIKIPGINNPTEIIEIYEDGVFQNYAIISKFLNEYIILEFIDKLNFSTEDILRVVLSTLRIIKESNKQGLFIYDIHSRNLMVNAIGDIQFIDFDTSFIIRDNRIFYDQSYAFREMKSYQIVKKYFNRKESYNNISEIRKNLILQEKHYLLEMILIYLYEKGYTKHANLRLMPYIVKDLKLPKIPASILTDIYSGQSIASHDYLEGIFEELLKEGYELKRVKK